MSDLTLEQAIAEMRDLVRCRCHPAFTERGLHDPSCDCDSAEAVEVLARALPAVQPAHVNETPKSEHDERVMLTLTAERDRLREALRHIVTYLAEPTVASEDTLNSLRGDLRFVGRVASAALKGESHD